jgi:uncharacterized protein
VRRGMSTGDAKTKLMATTSNIQAVILKLRQSDPAQSAPPLSLLQYQVYRDFVGNFQRLQDNVNPRDVGLDDLPAEIRQKFVSPSGLFLLRIHPRVDIWEREDAARFVADLRRVDPDVTGTPVITYESILLMERSYRQATMYAVILVAVVSYFMIRRVRETLLALLPLALGLVWMMGLMPLLGLKFTMGNIFGLPLIIGTSAEFGLNVVLRFMEDREHGGPLLSRSTVMAVLTNGLTTIAGFGSMMVADHRGIFGLGLLLTIGIITSLIASLIVLPAMLRLMKPPRAPHPPAPRVERSEPIVR